MGTRELGNGLFISARQLHELTALSFFTLNELNERSNIHKA